VSISHADLVWRVAATEGPLVVKDCAKCSGRSRFVCSEKFRVNAQQRSLDVWLIYRCTACDGTWNCRLVRRAAPTAIAPDLYAKFLSNDRDAARCYAFDLALLKRNGVKAEHRGEVVLEGPELAPDAFASGTARVLVRCELAGRWRLDRLLAPKLGISRSRLERLGDEGGIELDPPVKRLGAPLAARTLVVMRLDALREREEVELCV
jgi:hypothetical protein